MNHDLSFFIDTDKYPLDETYSERYASLVAEARAAIRADGCYVLKIRNQTSCAGAIAGGSSVDRGARALHEK